MMLAPGALLKLPLVSPENYKTVLIQLKLTIPQMAEHKNVLYKIFFHNLLNCEMWYAFKGGLDTVNEAEGVDCSKLC